MNRSHIKNIFIVALFFVFVLAIFLSSRTYAAELRLLYTPPCPSSLSGLIPGECPTDSNSSIAAYIVRIYRFSLGIAGLLAVGGIVVGGIYYIISGGNPQKQGEAKDWIVSALWGVVYSLAHGYF